MKFGWATALLLLVCVACAPSGGSSAVASSPTPPVNQATLSPDLTTAMTQAADSILAAVNVRRALVGISPLIQQPILVDAAQERSVDMAALGYLAHVNPENGRLEAEQILRSRGFLGQVAELLFQSVSPIEDIPGATVAAWFDGGQAIKFLTQYHEFGIDKRMPVIGATWGAFLAPYILAALPPAAADATIGYLVPTAYSPLLDNPVNKAFVADFKAKFHFTPEDTSAGVYQGAMCIIEALKATGGDTSPEKLRQALLSLDFVSPFGRVTFDQNTGVRHMDMHISKIVKQGKEFVWQPIFTYKDVPPLGY